MRIFLIHQYGFMLNDTGQSIGIKVKTHFELGVYRLHFPFQSVLIKNRGNEKLSQHVQGLLKMFFINGEIIVRVAATGPGVVDSRMLLDELTVLLFIRVFF